MKPERAERKKAARVHVSKQRGAIPDIIIEDVDKPATVTRSGKDVDGRDYKLTITVSGISVDGQAIPNPAAADWFADRIEAAFKTPKPAKRKRVRN